MSTDLTPERKLCDWIDANGIVMQGATPSMLLSAAGLDALTARAEAAERDLAAVTVSRDGWQPRTEAAEKKVAAIETLTDHYEALIDTMPEPHGVVTRTQEIFVRNIRTALDCGA